MTVIKSPCLVPRQTSHHQPKDTKRSSIFGIADCRGVAHGSQKKTIHIACKHSTPLRCVELSVQLRRQMQPCTALRARMHGKSITINLNAIWSRKCGSFLPLFSVAIRTSEQVVRIGIFAGMIYRYDARDAGDCFGIGLTQRWTPVAKTNTAGIDLRANIKYLHAFVTFFRVKLCARL